MYVFVYEMMFSILRALTLVVLILFPEEHIQPELSGSVLHSSPSRHGSISHHHFPITMEAAEKNTCMFVCEREKGRKKKVSDMWKN